MHEDLSTSTTGPEPTLDDPHAPKVDPNDARLRIERPRSRTLKTKPIIACAALVAALGMYAVLLRAGKPAKKVAIAEEPKIPIRPPSVPDIIAQAPAEPTPPPVVSPPPRPSADSPFWAASPVASAPIPKPDPVVQRATERAAQLTEQARDSGMFFQAPARTEPAPAASVSGALAPYGAPGQPTAPGAAAAATAGGPSQWDPNLQARKNAFLDAPRPSSDYLPTSLQSPVSPYELKATAIIPATLITGINSDLPGPIIAQVREQVFDTVTGQHLLIPQGARLLATYDSMVAWGQERVLLCWNRLIFPNGKSINLACMPAADLQGQAGLADEVNEHWGRLFAAAGLSTVLSLGTQAAAGNTTGYQPTLAQSAARSAAGEINSIGQTVVQRQINIQPTITVRPGFGLNVIVTKDMVLEPYND